MFRGRMSSLFETDKQGGASSSSLEKPGAVLEIDESSGLSDFEYGVNVATSVHSVRLGFLRKVYGILSVQLLLTVIISTLFMVIQPLQNFVLHAPWFTMLAIFSSFGFLIGLFCVKDRYPLNMQLLFGFTLCESISVGTICAAYAKAGLGFIVIEALFITLLVFSGLTLYCFVSKKDFSFLGGFLYAALMSLVVGSLFMLVFSGFGGKVSPLLGFAFSVIGSLVFCGYILFDTSMIIKHFSPDQYIEAAIALYLDLINLFLYILQILSYLQDRN
mmetsp:Transcript_11394/g.11421  ORF Transcript_11394/g.11421 Transcript_11394/m.11421 type:complete len:274 (+) Transcript_11394:49-870(+)